MEGINDKSPIDYVPDLLLRRIFLNLPLTEQFLTLRLVNNRFWNNLPAEYRLKSIYYKKYFESLTNNHYSQLLSICGGKWLRNLYFDSNIELITADILIPFADNCPNIRSITVTNVSDDAAAILPRFGNLKNLKVNYCSFAIRQALQHLRLVKLFAGYVDINDPQAPLVAEPERLRVLTGADFSRSNIEECGALTTQFVRNFPNLQVLKVGFIGDPNKIAAIFKISIIRKYFLNLKHLRFIVFDRIRKKKLSLPLPISCTEFSNLSTLDLDASHPSFYNIDWSRPLISTLPCSAHLRRLNISLRDQDASVIHQLLSAITTHMPQLRTLAVYAKRNIDSDGDIFPNSMVNLTKLRHLSLDVIWLLERLKNFEEFLELLSSSDVLIQSFRISQGYFDMGNIAPISRLKWLTVLHISTSNKELVQQFFTSSLIWPSLRNLRFCYSINRFVCNYSQKIVDDRRLEVAFPRLTVFEFKIISELCISFCIRPLLQKFVLRLPRLVDFRIKIPIFSIDDGIMELLACSRTLRHLEFNTHEDNAIYFRDKGYLLLCDKRRRKIRETGIFPGELEIIIIVKNRKEFFKIGGLSDA